MITLLHDKVGIKPIGDPDVSPSGRIIIPDMAKERTDQGIVTYVGPRVKHLKIGDYALFGGYNGTTIQLESGGDAVIIVMRERFIVGALGAPNTQIAGLFFKDNEGDYIPATYEVTMGLIAESFRNTDFAKNTGFKSTFDSRPDVIEYDQDVDTPKITNAPLMRNGDIDLLGDRVLVIQDPADLKVGKLHLSGAHAKKPRTGVVHYAGPGIYENDEFVPTTVKKDNKVIFSEGAGKDVKIKGVEYRLMYEGDIIAIYE